MTLGLFYPEDPTGQQGQSNRLVTARWQTATGWSAENPIGGAVAFTADIWSRDITAVQQHQRLPYLQLFYPGYGGGVRWLWQDPLSLSWSPEQNLGGTPDGGPIAAVLAPGRLLELFYPGAGGGVRTIWRDPSSGSWSSEHNLGGTPASAVTAIVAPDTDVVQLFYAEADGGVYTIVGNNPGGLGPAGWSAPRQLGHTSPQAQSDITAILVPGANGTQVVQLFYVGITEYDVNVFTLKQDPDATWPAGLTAVNLGGTPPRASFDIAAIHVPGAELVQLFYPGGPDAEAGAPNVCSLAQQNPQDPDGSWSAEQNLGGIPQTDITAIADPDTELMQLFYVGIPTGANNVACCTLKQNPDKTWSTQQSLGGGIPSAAITAAVNAPIAMHFTPPSPIVLAHQVDTNQLDAVFAGPDGALNVMWVVGDGTWQGPAPLTGPGTTTAGAPIALAHQVDTNQLDAVFAGPDGALNVMWVVGDGVWKGPVALTGPGATTAGAPIALAHQVDTNQLDAVFAGPDGALNVMWVVGDGTWQGPAPLTGPGATTPGAPIALAHQVDTNQLDAVFAGPDGALNVMWVAGDGTWQGPAALTGPGATTPGAPIALAHQVDTNQLDAVFAGPDGALNVMWVVGDGTWQGPVALTGPGATTAGASIALAHQVDTNQLDAFYVSLDGALNVMWVVGDGTWQGPAPLTGPAAAAPGYMPGLAHQVSNNQLDAVFGGLDGAVNILWVVGSGNWVGPDPLTGPGATAP